ncbi:tRNA uridine(34) hydroxylase-like [Mustelus asterias]
MEPVTEWIRHRFPTVENVSADTVEQWLKEKRERLLLLDVRSPGEYQISHLQGAVRVDPETTDMDHLVKNLGLEGSQDQTVICYCTAGYHGSEMAQKIHSFSTRGQGPEGPGPLNVYNLEGGLAKWANESKALVDSEDRPTSLIHPYNREWAELVRPEFRAPI